MCAAPKGHKAYKGCETGGRPKRWTPEIIEGLADELLIWIKDQNSIWLKDFFLERGIHPNKISIWSKENEKFQFACELSKEFQESRIFKGGLMNAYNAQITKFALINNHGWFDKNEVKVSGDGLNPIALAMDFINGTSKELVSDTEDKSG